MFLSIPAVVWVFIGLFLLFCIGMSYCLFRKNPSENDEELSPENHQSTLEKAAGIETEY